MNIASENCTLLERIVGRLTGPRATVLLGNAIFRLMGIPSAAKELSLSSVKSVLVVRLDEIGDVVLTSAFLRELRHNLPEAWISLVVKPSVSNLVERCPFVNEVLTFEWIARGQWSHLVRQIRLLRLASQWLWRRHFDLAISPRCGVDRYSASKLLFFSGAPWRVGWSEDVVTPQGSPYHNFNRLLSQPISHPRGTHHAELNLELLRNIGGVVENSQLELWLDRDDEAFADKTLHLFSLTEGPLVAMGVGAGAAKRLWPEERFVEIGKWLVKEFCARLIIVGGPSDEATARRISEAVGDVAVSIAGKATLRQTAACLKNCSLFVGNDSGPMHLAAAAHVPVVAISCHPAAGLKTSSNSPDAFGPWGVRHCVLQPVNPVPPCKGECEADAAHCITGVKVDDVQAAVTRILSREVPNNYDGQMQSKKY